MWCVPKLDAEYIACMEDVLNVLARPYDEREPVVGFDERPVAAARGEPTEPVQGAWAHRPGGLRVRAKGHGEHLLHR